MNFSCYQFRIPKIEIVSMELEMNEKAAIEQELSVLIEKTLSLEDELNRFRVGEE